MIASVVVPAHNEEAVLGRCLASLRDPGLDVVVIANACTDGTAAIAREAGVRVIETPTPGKAHAIRLGDESCTTFPRIYMDADVEVSASSVRALAAALARPGILAAAPVPSWELSGVGWAARRVHRVHDALLAPTRALAGVGVYALTAEGHARVFPLPDVISDDGWVHRAFTAEERVVVREATSVVRPARTLRAELRRRARVRRGNRELSNLGRPAPEGGLRLGSLRGLVLDRTVSPIDALVYLTVVALTRVRALNGRSGWGRDGSSR
ncbi:hypothetical protein Lesp02_10740 [Lentzea sp. NBRC 105346]|uniref:glycosyltransferase n=1 Tax=Lentzea sp. NBRC 105346 TaxID=3032205 RepID=UPI0024A0A66C|nr:glycosyltransferase [Lentzea sp. NBRC 105346]GLZ28884.1 hypothetical protein Lesp02_10740 [Lentzea sp. NBRC 105346]